MNYLGVDIGGTNIRFGVIDTRGKIVFKKRVPTLEEEGCRKTVSRLLKEIESLIKKSKIEIKAIGIGCPGPLDSKRGIVLSPPNLPDWKNLPLRQIIKDKFHLPVYLGNDANCAGLGENWLGAGRDSKSMVLLTLGTGIGSAVVYEGRLLTGEGFAAELGHVSINPRGLKCGCGSYGCLEAYASATAMVKRMKSALKRGRRSSKFNSKNLNTITAASIYQAAKMKDKLSKEILDETAFYLGIAIANIANALNPQIVVLAGGMIKAGRLLFDEIIKTAGERALPQTVKSLKIVPAKLGQDAGVIGAAHLAMIGG